MESRAIAIMRNQISKTENHTKSWTVTNDGGCYG